MRGATTEARPSPPGTRGRARRSPPALRRPPSLARSRSPPAARRPRSVLSLVRRLLSRPPSSPSLGHADRRRRRREAGVGASSEVSERASSWRRGAPGPPAPHSSGRPPPGRGRAPPAAPSWPPRPLTRTPGPFPRSGGSARPVPGSAPAASRAPSPARPGLAEPRRPPAVPGASSLSAGRAGAPSCPARVPAGVATGKKLLQLHFVSYIERET